MCKKKIQGEDKVCINTACEEHMLSDKLRLLNPNFKSLTVWAFLGCMNNLRVLKEEGLGFTLEAIGESWGISRERVRQIEADAVKRFKHNFKTMLKGDHNGQSYNIDG